MMRTPRRAHAINTGRVNVIGRTTGEPSNQGRRPYCISNGHKQKMLDALATNPDGLLTAELAELIGVGVARTTNLLGEMEAQGLVGRIRDGRLARWFAEV